MLVSGIPLYTRVLQVKKWTATQKNWSLWSMFMAVSNFAAAPTGGSLITKFFKQPSTTAQAQHKQAPSADEDQLLQAQGLPEKALSSERQHGFVMATEPSPQCQSAEQGKHPLPNDRQLKSLGSSAAGEEQPSKGKSPPMASPTKALTSASAIGLQGNAPAGMSALPLSAQSSNAQHNQAAASWKQPSALLHATAGLAHPQGLSQPDKNTVLPSSPCATSAMSDDNTQSHHGNQDSSAVMAAFREDTSGASDPNVQAQAGQSYRDLSKAHGPAQQGAAKRPLEQALTKEPEHRKKPNRCDRIFPLQQGAIVQNMKCRHYLSFCFWCRHCTLILS